MGGLEAVEVKEEGGRMGKPPWRAKGNDCTDADRERREVERGFVLQGSIRDEEEEEEGEEEELESTT